MSDRFGAAREAAHLVRRFLGALWPGCPPPADRAWVASVLRPGELELFERLPCHDRRHLIRVARRVESLLSAGIHAHDPRWIAAALCHDVGKVEADLGIAGRVVATLCERARGARIATWEGRAGLRGRVATYARHGELGAAMLRAVEGHEEAARWAEVHDRPAERPAAGFPPEVLAALVTADG